MNAGLSFPTLAKSLRSLIVSNPTQNLSVRQLEDDFTQMIGQPIPFAAFGFSSTLELLRSMPDVVKVTGSNVRAVPVPSIVNMQHLVAKNKITNNRAKNKKIYKNVAYRTPIADSYQEQRSNATIRPSAPPDRIGSNTSFQRQNQQRNEVSWINCLTMPTDAMGATDRFPTKDLHALNKSRVRVWIRHVLNPNRLWIHLDSATGVFSKLTTELNEYFGGCTMTKQWGVERAHAQKGLACAAEWHEQWHRATIAGPVVGTHVMVYLVDLGLTENVQLSALKYLPKMFSSTPVQAIRASMAYLAPQNAYWRRKNSHDLQNMLNELGMLDAFVIDVDQKSVSLDVVLFSSNNCNVNQEFAALTECKWLWANFTTQNDAAYRQRSRTFNEQYPSFADIEEGRYPTVAELERALLRGFDFECHYTHSPHGQRGLAMVEEFKLSARRLALNTLALSNPFRELFE